MAKKKPLEAQEKRYGSVSAKLLDNGIEDLAQLLAGLAACRDTIKDTLKVDEITVDGVTKLARGTDLIKSFVVNLETAIIKEKYE